MYLKYPFWTKLLLILKHCRIRTSWDGGAWAPASFWSTPCAPDLEPHQGLPPPLPSTVNHHGHEVVHSVRIGRVA